MSKTTSNAEARFGLVAAAASLAMIAAAGPALAQPADQTARLEALEAQLKLLQQEITELKAKAAAAPAPAQASAGGAKPATVAIENGRPTIASGDGRFTAVFRGVFQLDAANYGQDAPGPLATDFRRGSFGDAVENERARDLADGTNFRRVRIGVEGRAFKDFGYHFLYDFGGAGVEDPGKVIGAYLQYDGFDPLKLRAGAFPPTTGFEDAVSNSASLFAERAAAVELVRNLAGGDGRMGAMAFAGGPRWTAQAALTGNVAGTSSFDEQTGFVGRVSFAPLKGEDWLIHVGANANLIFEPSATGPEVPGGAPRPVRLRERPELRVDGTRLVDTGSIDAEGVTALGLEFGAQYKSLHLQAEAFNIDVERRASLLSDPDFFGWYVQAGWTLTGEPRRYQNGGFDAPRVAKPFSRADGGWGVWELGLRYSVLDLNYLEGAAGTAPVASAIRGGRQEIVTVGLNWYLNALIRFQAAYQHVQVDRLSPGGVAFGAGAATPPAGAQVGQELDIWSLRTQYAF